MTTRHLAEFWMIEPELAFADLAVVNECAEGYVRFCIQYVLEHCAEDLVFFEQQYEKGLIQRLQVGHRISHPRLAKAFTQVKTVLPKLA